ncbi:CFA_G0021410.mRNA.1.CDS.1 [Saccharomyces cerevisiae]|nr:CFA_G0021410.mRNA.1.CDS.1 [Saccharomyces cerevisiae]CAI4499640.1 CQI_4a_G0021440.mRNA.1.CDS.1 [Saccharomyces cerevisiae]CAI5277892.1 BAF_HP2_G0021190.mRNA.1.CDS.1 [Saccharomyces cerevisiae]CAI6515131.1 BAF_HP1_G0021550.mRNA.1.CDS.1 [Saccharomyces cerevisiae]CAI6540484.1 BAF_HP2_G0021190.mRNA.1.CDS.1 [Saccharomyces cerevisiae]
MIATSRAVNMNKESKHKKAVAKPCRERQTSVTRAMRPAVARDPRRLSTSSSPSSSPMSAQRRLSREEIINEMEKEQDAIVVRLLREIETLKEENSRLKNQLHHPVPAKRSSPFFEGESAILDDDDCNYEEEDEESSNKKQKNEETEEPATIFVGRLSWSIDDEWLKKEFEHIGGVIGARVIYERGTDRSRGYGYVDFENKSYAEKAIQEMQGKEIDGRPINCDMSTSKPAGNNDRAKKFGDTPSEPSDTLFLGNLSFNADRDAIFELFAKHGEVVSVRIPTHPETEQPKGFGYVQFSNMEDAKKALDALQGEYIDNRPVRLDFSSPRPNNDGGRGGSRGFGGRGGGRGGNRGFGGRGGARGGRGGFRPSGSGANTAPLGRSRNTASFAGSKKTFD